MGVKRAKVKLVGAAALRNALQKVKPKLTTALAQACAAEARRAARGVRKRR
jgi:hypothetical protein